MREGLTHLHIQKSQEAQHTLMEWHDLSQQPETLVHFPCPDEGEGSLEDLGRDEQFQAVNI